MTSSGSCHLLGGLFAEGVQAALAVIALLSLIVKWRLESPRRQVMVWLMDVSKQAGSGIFAHCLNILAAELLSLDSSVQDQCAWYFINFALDTSLGVGVAWATLQLVQRLAARCRCASLARSGDYKGGCRTWVAQLLAWLGITLVVKLVVISVILLAKRPFTHLSNDISDVFQGHPKLELVAVMIACPCIMNVVQFWVQDAFLKHPSKRGDGVLLASTTSRSTGSSRASPASHSSCSGSGLSDPMLPSASRPIERGACSRGDSSLQADDAVATSVAIASCASHAPTTQYGAVDGDADAYAATMSGASVAIAVDRERF